MKPGTNKQKVLKGGLKSVLLAATAKCFDSFWFCTLCLTLIHAVGPVTILAAPTVQDFDQPGTPYTLTSVYGVPATLAHYVIINRFETDSEVSQWLFDFGGATHNAVFDPVADANRDPASGAMKITLGFDAALDGENKGAYTRPFFPAVDGSTLTSMQMDVRVDPASAFDAFGNSGYFEMVIRNTGNYDWNVQFADSVRAVDGWRHIVGSPLVGPVNDIRAITWQLYGGASLNGPVTLWIDNVSFTSPGAGGAESPGNFLRLASQNLDTANNIAFDLTAPGKYSQVVAEFDFRMTPTPFSRADGLGFALLNTSCFSASGPGPDLSEEPNFSGSFGVSFDIYQNEWDPNNNHVSLHFNGQEKAVFPFDIATFDLADGQFHHAAITIDFVLGGANVGVSMDGVFTPVANHFVAGMTPYESRVAFGARTGGEFADHDLDNIRVEFDGQLPSGPLGYWKFDDGSGMIARDSSGLGNDVSIYGASWGASYFGPVLCFDGLDDYVDISSLPDLCQGSIEAWVNRTVLSGDREIVSGILVNDFATTGGEFAIYVGEWLGSGVVLAPDAWYHLVATFDGSTWKVYVNGVLKNSLATSYVFNHPNKFIGQFHDFGPWNWNGCLAEVRIYDAALTEEEVLANFNARSRPLVPVPVDVRPGDCPNPLNTRSVGTLPMAIVGVPGFNVAAVDVSSVTLGNVSPRNFAAKDVSAPFSPFLGRQDCLKDCSKSRPDRIKDLILYFDHQEVIATLGQVTDGQCLVLPLTGYLTDGTPIMGEDVVLILDRR